MLEGRLLSKLKLVRIGRAVRRAELESMAHEIDGALAPLLESIETLDYDPPRIDRIEAALLTQALDHEVGGHILAVTDIDLVERDTGEYSSGMFGCKDNRNDVAVVSTHRIESRDPERSLARLVRVGLHELGHNFGLVHHYSRDKAPGGGYCVMAKDDYNRHGEQSYKRAVIDARGAEFCAACWRMLRLARGAPAVG